MTSKYKNHTNKRIKINKSNKNPIKPSPSPIVHIRNLYNNIIKKNLTKTIQQFKNINYIILIPKKHQTLIEFKNISKTTNYINYSNKNQIFIANQPTYFNYSTNQRIQKPNPKKKNKQTNHILLFTILNPQYPVTINIIHTIYNPYKQIIRIIIFKKNNIQNIIKFNNVKSTKRTKQTLNKTNIYSDYNTLKIKYTKTNKLNIFKNNQNN